MAPLCVKTRQLGDHGLMETSVVTMMHAVRRFFRFGHVHGLIPADPAVYARLPKVHRDESRTHGLDRLALIRFLPVAQTIGADHCCSETGAPIGRVVRSEPDVGRCDHAQNTPSRRPYVRSVTFP